MIRIAFAVIVGAAVLSGGAAVAACPDGEQQPQRHHAKKPAQAGCVDLNTVSQISADLVAAEPAPVVKVPTYSEPTPAKYVGPTLGLTKPDPGVRAVPTVGYNWSLQ